MSYDECNNFSEVLTSPTYHKINFYTVVTKLLKVKHLWNLCYNVCGNTTYKEMFFEIDMETFKNNPINNFRLNDPLCQFWRSIFTGLIKGLFGNKSRSSEFSQNEKLSFYKGSYEKFLWQLLTVGNKNVYQKFTLTLKVTLNITSN